MAYGVIYGIENRINHKIYVGQTTRTIKERFKQHCRADTYMGCSIRKYGEENFIVILLEECNSREELDEAEKRWIARLNCRRPNGYNYTKGGDGSVNFKHTESTLLKLRLTRKGKKHSAKTREKMSASQIGHPVLHSTRMKLSIANKIVVFPNLNSELERQGLTYTELAKMVNMPVTTLTTKMNGRAKMKPQNMQAIYNALNVDIPIEELFKKIDDDAGITAPSVKLTTNSNFVGVDLMSVTNIRWYPKYHIAAPAGWVNDPNGFCYFKGDYHLFAQHHPYSAQWGPMHYSHVISKDLTHWKHLPIALKPDEDYDRDGCFSGCGIEKDGKLYIFYTGNMHTPETAELGFDYVQVQCFAVSEDGVNFKKYPDNAVILVPETDQVHGGDFRDPKVWKHGDKYYMVVGSRTPDKLLGQVLLYESDDIIHWNFKSIMSRAEGNQGSMWECPNFATIDGKDVLIFSPQDVKRELNSYLNVYQSGYFIGKLDYNTGIYTHGDFELLDYGSDFYAPQITQIPDGRTVMVAWLDMWGNPMPEQADGWAGMMTVPRELHVKDGKVYSTPIKELESLRVAETSYEDKIFYEPTKFEGVSGDIGELIVNIDLKATEEFEIDLRSSADEKTVLTYNAALGLFKVNRDKSGEGGKGERECPILPADKMKLHIFMDRSSIEIFINDGEKVMSARVYPRDNSRDIVFVPTSGTFKIDSLKFYTLGEGIPQP